jgi:tetratricopeptide (TPR) repeat protein
MTSGVKMKALALALAVTLVACGGAEERKAKYMEKGKNYFAEKNYDKAKIEFKNVLQIDPKFAEGYYYMGQVEEKSRDLQKAAGNYNKVIELNPEYLDAKVKLARIYTIVGTEEYIGNAESLLKEVFAKQPDHVEAILIDATINSRRGDKNQAIAKLRKVIERDPGQREAYSLLSVIQASQGNEDSAISTLKDGIQKNNDAVGLRMMLAQMLVKNSRDVAEAENQLKKIVEIEPDNFNFRIALASFYSTSNQVDKAEAVLRQAIVDDEEDAKRYLALVELLAGRKSAKAAEDELLAAINKKPDLYDLRFALVKFYQQLQLTDKAIEALNYISDKQDFEPEGIKAKVQLADIYLARGDISKAQSLINDVLEEKPNDPSALLVSGKIAFQKQDDQTVINALRTVLKDEPKNSEASLLLAQAHERNNETELAKETLMRALEADPLNPKNHLNYANYQAGKNDMKGAEQTLDKALAYFKADYDLMDGKLKFAAFNKNESAVKELLDQMKLAFPNKEEVFMHRGQYFASKKQYPQALEEFETALKNSVSVYKPLEAVIQTLLIMNQEQKAIDKLQARLAGNADDAIANQFMGQIYFGRKDYTKALEYFAKAMKQAVWEVPYASAASVYMITNNVPSALSVLESGVAKVANPIGLQMQMAAIYENQKAYDKAMAIYEQVLQSNPANQVVINNLATLLVDFKTDAASAKRALELVAGIAKNKQSAFMDTVGWVNLKNNNAAKAVSILEEVIRMAPNAGIFQYHLGMAYHAAGDMANAKRYLSQAVESKQEYPGKDQAKATLAKL